MKLYMDVCCLARPFDDLSQDRINLEAEAVLSIISNCENGEWTLLSSGVIDFEISQIPDLDIQEKISAIYSSATEHHEVNQKIIDRANNLNIHNIKHFDSLHLSIAESANADVLLTTDDRFVKRAKNTDSMIRVANPVTWLMEVTDDE